jgi:cytochrome c biogenesis protein CcmG/thiol:disulfide interchange protein DsbE
VSFSRRLLLLLALTTVAATPLAAQDVGLPLGTSPRAVAVEDLDGNAVDLGQYLGRKPVLIEFWAQWCELCEALEPRLRAAATKYQGRAEVLVMAVAVNQSRRSVKRHLQEHQLPGRVLWDAGGRATRAFQAPTTSYVVALDARGRVVYTGTGEDQDLEAALARAVTAR